MNRYNDELCRERAVRISAELLRDAGNLVFPLDIEKLLTAFSYQVFLYPYSKLKADKISAETDNSPNPVQMSKDGFCVRQIIASSRFHSEDQTGYVWNVYYNDSSLPERTRFTLLHELGHVFLGHHQMLGIETTFDTDSTPEYKAVDEQADLFSINTLAPAPSAARLLREHGFSYDRRSNAWKLTETNAPFLRNLGQTPDPIHLLKMAFGISTLAAERRLAELQDELKIWEALDPALYAYIEQIPHRSGWYCWVCNTRRRSTSPYCPGCGNGMSYEYKDTGHNIRPVIRLKENGQFSFCSVCGNAEFPEDAKYCPVCGNLLVNECLNARYDDGDFIRSGMFVVRGTHKCKPTDIYCGQCGMLTTFGEQHGPKKNMWLPTRESDRCRIVGTSYPQIYQTEERFLKTCPACGSERSIRDGRYCADCMQPLENCCIGGKNGNHPCLPNDRYCTCCGQPTIFFQAGYLTEYTQTDTYRHLLEDEMDSLNWKANQMIIDSNGAWELWEEQ